MGRKKWQQPPCNFFMGAATTASQMDAVGAKFLPYMLQVQLPMLSYYILPQTGDRYPMQVSYKYY
jgi:hypothetical protein